jgi:beta-glucuronidase
MKIPTFLALSFAALSAFAELETIPLDGTWDFAFERRAALPSARADFAATDKMVVPGCFDLMPKWYAQRGLAHYRRAFALASPAEGAYLRVKGMGLQARFFIDGREAGTVKYPYLEFEVDLGPLVAGHHELVVALDNNLDGSKDLVFKPNYDFFLSGGFYHGVELRLRHASVELDRVVVRTRDYKTGTVELALEAKGELPADVKGEVSFDGGEARSVRFENGRARLEVPSFRLWSPESPNLHRVRVATEFGACETRFGIREFVAREKSFFLNGEKTWLRGVNRHDSDPEEGYATTRATMLRDIQLMKSIGCNYVRGSHYPQCEEFLDLCDELGLMVWEESLGWGNWKDLDDPGFIEGQIEQTRATVRNSINHPSVVISAFLNEFGSNLENGRVLAEKLIAVIRAEDTGHLVSYAGMHAYDDICSSNVDFIAFNSYPAWHGQIGRGSTPESLEKVIREQFEGSVKSLRGKYGEEKPIIVSETGCYSLYGSHDPMGAQWTEEFQSEYLDHWLKAVTASPEMCGFTVWQFCDSRTYFRGGSDIRLKPLGYNLAGLFDRHRNAKLAATTVKRHFEAQKVPTPSSAAIEK